LGGMVGAIVGAGQAPGEALFRLQRPLLLVGVGAALLLVAALLRCGACTTCYAALYSCYATIAVQLGLGRLGLSRSGAYSTPNRAASLARTVPDSGIEDEDVEEEQEDEEAQEVVRRGPGMPVGWEEYEEELVIPSAMKEYTIKPQQRAKTRWDGGEMDSGDGEESRCMGGLRSTFSSGAGAGAGAAVAARPSSTAAPPASALNVHRSRDTPPREQAMEQAVASMATPIPAPPQVRPFWSDDPLAMPPAEQGLEEEDGEAC